MPLISEVEFNNRVEKYVEEIKDLRRALKYATDAIAVYHGKLIKLNKEEGRCPICGTVSDRQTEVFGQKGGSLAGQPSFEAPSQPS